MNALQDPDPERRARARAVARRLHPDLGGDPAAYLAALAELDARDRPAARSTRAGATTAPTGDGGLRARARRAVRRRARAAVRTARARVPRRLPGARRWARL